MEEKGIFITGTDTGVGKTLISALFTRYLMEKGINATYLKTIATGCEMEDGALVPEDLTYVSSVLEKRLDLDHHCPIRFKDPLSPLAASRQENRDIPIELILKAYQDLASSHEFVVVEGVGGTLVPIKKGYFVADLISDLHIGALVVARPGLGTINHTLLTFEALKARGIRIFGFFTNGLMDSQDPSALTNGQIIQELGQLPYLGHVPFFGSRADLHAYVTKPGTPLEALFQLIKGEPPP